MDEPSREQQIRDAVQIYVMLAMLMAGLLGLLFIGEKSLWFDEIASLDIAHDWGAMWDRLWRGEANMWLYYIPLFGWLKLGDSPELLRMPSVFYAVLTLPAMYSLGATLFNRRLGLLAVLLLTVNPMFIVYAQEARGYSMLLMMSAVSSALFVSAVKNPQRRQLWILYAAAGAVSIWVHFFALLVILVHALTLAVVPRKPLRNLFLAAATGLLLLLPIPFVQDLKSGQIGWIPPLDFARLKEFALAMTWYTNELLMSYALLAALALVMFVVRRRFSWEFAFMLLFAVVPMLVTVVYSLLIQPIFVDRYLIYVLLPLMLLVSYGILSLKRRMLILVALGFVLLFSAKSLHGYYWFEVTWNWDEAAAVLVEEAQPGDALYFADAFSYVPTAYYLRRYDPDLAGSLSGRTYFLETAPFTNPSLPQARPLDAADAHARIWFVYETDNTGAEELALFDPNYELMREIRFQLTVVNLYESRQ